MTQQAKSDDTEPSPQDIDVGEFVAELKTWIEGDSYVEEMLQQAASLIERLVAEHAEDVYSNLKLQDEIKRLRELIAKTYAALYCGNGSMAMIVDDLRAIWKTRSALSTAGGGK